MHWLKYFFPIKCRISTFLKERHTLLQADQPNICTHNTAEELHYNPTGLVNNQEVLQIVGRLRPKTWQLSCGLGSQRMFGRFLKIWKHSAPGRRWKEWAGNHFLRRSCNHSSHEKFSPGNASTIKKQQLETQKHTADQNTHWGKTWVLSYFFKKDSYIFLPHTKLLGHREFYKLFIQKYLFTYCTTKHY